MINFRLGKDHGMCQKCRVWKILFEEKSMLICFGCADSNLKEKINDEKGFSKERLMQIRKSAKKAGRRII